MAIIKFVHKEPLNKEPGFKGLVVYYNRTDIILGLILIAFSAFFIYKYFQLSIVKPVVNAPVVASQSAINKPAHHDAQK